MSDGIYGVIHRPTGRWYVGRSCNISKRWRGHRHSARSGSVLRFHEALREYPAREFTWIELELCDRVVHESREEYWISRLGAFERGFNSTEGGEKTPGDYDAIRRKMSVAQVARTDRPFKGRRHSEASLRLIREAAKTRGPEWRAKISVANLGRIVSPEIRERLRGSRNRGEKNPFFGRTHSEATRRKISETHKGIRRTSIETRNLVLELRGKGLSLKVISKRANVSKGTASRLITEVSGKLPTGAAGRERLKSLRSPK